jgi:ribokinase
VIRPLPASLLARVTWLTPNEHELAVLTGLPASTPQQVEQGAQKLRSLGVTNVVVTCGARGACWVSAAGVRWFPARTVKVVDTVGAGDCFSGVLAAKILAGDAGAEAVHHAVVAATRKVTQKGARPDVACETTTT